ncbi:MAG: outer membrane protein transport protein [bacterium]|nr:MAG: outer membrane protein transport protein [bacterium]
MTLLLIVAAVLIFSAGPALAGAFRIPESGAAAMGQGNAFVGQADDPSAVHHNPAAITGLEGIQIMAGFTQITPESEFEGVGAEKDTFYPPYFFYANRLRETDWYIGFGVNAPFGLGTEWDETAPFNAFFRSTVTPVNPVDIVTETALEIAKIAPVAAYRVNDKFSVGFGPEYYDVQKVVYKGGTTIGGGVGVEYSLKGDGDGFGFVASGMYQATDALRIGFAWHSGVTAELTGNAVNFPSDAGTPISTKASVDLNLPDTMALGFHYQVNERLSLNLDLDQTQWSDYDKLEFKRSDGSPLRTINKGYDDVLAVRFGGQYKVNDNWTVRAGFHTEPTPVVEETFDPRLPDSDATSITVGAGYDAGSYAINFAYMALSKDDRTVDTDEPNPLLNTLFDGEYKSSVDLLALDVTFRF